MAKIILDRGKRRADVVGLDVIAAGWAGYCFAKNHPDLVQEGWHLHYFEGAKDDSKFPTGSVLADKVAGLIKFGPDEYEE